MSQANTNDHLNQMTTVLQTIADNMAARADFNELRAETKRSLDAQPQYSPHILHLI